MKDKERKLTCYSNPLLCRRTVEFLGFGFFYAPSHIAKFILKNQSECGVAFRGGVAPVVVFVISRLRNAKSMTGVTLF